MNWYIGQEIVCIDGKQLDHPALKEGQIYTIKALKESFCRCGEVLIDVGFRSDVKKMQCRKCGISDIPKTDNTKWYIERRFAPLQDLTEQIAELLEQKITI